MPARTLDADTATLSPLRYAAHSPSWGRFDAGDNVGASDTPVRAPLHLQRGPSYPASPPMQRTDHGAWQPYSFGPHNMSYNPLAPGWLPHPPGMRVVPMVPPPPLLHKVWILDCKTCGNFLTNRGMKAVLLLRPNVSLYSTDAMPINCSAHAATIEASTSTPRARAASIASPQDPAAARTCECLTQTLWCHGCGTSVGYMIVTPCHRCTSSTTANNRTTNGHRFVFYSNGIAASERHYIPDELGVDVDARLPLSLPMQLPVPGAAPAHRPRYVPVNVPTRPSPASPRRASWSNSRPNARSPDPRDASRLPMSPSSPTSEALDSPPPPSPPSPISSPRPAQEPERLRAGDIVYWHQLTRSGEIPAVSDNPRARAPGTSRGESITIPQPTPTTKEATPPVTSGRKMVAGR